MAYFTLKLIDVIFINKKKEGEKIQIDLSLKNFSLFSISSHRETPYISS